MHIAAQEGHVAVVEALAVRGAGINTPDTEGLELFLRFKKKKKKIRFKTKTKKKHISDQHRCMWLLRMVTLQ